MPALPSVPSVIRFDIRQHMDSTPLILNRLYFRYSSQGSATDLITLCNDVLAQWVAHVATFQSSDIHVDTVHATDLASSTAPEADSTSAGSAGAEPGRAMAPGVALVIKHGIARRYRGGKPRTYLAGIQQAWLGTDGLWVPSDLALIVAGFGTFADNVVGLTSGGYTMNAFVNVSYFSGFTVVDRSPLRPIIRPNLRGGGPVVDVINTNSGNPKPASQRRRNEQQL